MSDFTDIFPVQQIDTAAALSPIRSNAGGDNIVITEILPLFHDLNLCATQAHISAPVSSSLMPPNTHPGKTARSENGSLMINDANVTTPRNRHAPTTTTPNLEGVQNSPFTPINTPTPAPRTQSSLRLRLQSQASKIKKQ